MPLNSVPGTNPMTFLFYCHVLFHVFVYVHLFKIFIIFFNFDISVALQAYHVSTGVLCVLRILLSIVITIVFNGMRGLVDIVFLRAAFGRNLLHIVLLV